MANDWRSNLSSEDQQRLTEVAQSVEALVKIITGSPEGAKAFADALHLVQNPPPPAAELTPEQKRIIELEAQVAEQGKGK
jgi:hypothetical protein